MNKALKILPAAKLATRLQDLIKLDNFESFEIGYLQKESLYHNYDNYEKQHC